MIIVWAPDQTELSQVKHHAAQRDVIPLQRAAFILLEPPVVSTTAEKLYPHSA